jgi:RsiW-degrading membrane proteinase PrsW (M82 family)
MILLIASATPVIIFLFLLLQRDKHPEPASLLAKCFFGGFLVAVLAVIIESLLDIYGSRLDGHPLSFSLYTAFIVAAGTEELLKWFMVKKIIWNRNEFDQHYDGIIYAVFVSLGFAFIENVGYVYQSGLGTAVFRAILAVPGHGFWAVIMGYYLSLAKFDKEGKQKEYLWKSILVPIFFHGLYDFCLFYLEKQNGDNPTLILSLVITFTLCIIFFWVRGIKNIKAHLKQDGM